MSGAALSLAVLSRLSVACAPTVAPETMVALVRTESAGRPYAIGVNGAGGGSRVPATFEAAVAAAAELIAAGRSNIDLGLGQLNARYNAERGITLEDAFDPCRNLAASSRVLTACYARQPAALDPQVRLRRALSCYNTGGDLAGFGNGYVVRVEASAGVVVPAIRVPGEAPAAKSTPFQASPPPPCAPVWDPWATVACERRRPAAPPSVASPGADATDADPDLAPKDNRR